MALKDIWADIIDGESEIVGEDINNIAHAVIEIEKNGGNVAFSIDTQMSDTSENAVQNKVIKAYIDGKTEDFESILDELHNYAQAFINGGVSV
jgi:hypothetical protein